MSRNRGGRPRKPLPEGIGEVADDAVAYRSTRNGRPMTKARVFALRKEHKIPAAPTSARGRNQYDD